MCFNESEMKYIKSKLNNKELDILENEVNSKKRRKVIRKIIKII